MKKIGSCDDCPFMEAQRVYTEDSWEMVFKWTCTANKKVITSYHETFDKTPIPKWCPIKDTKLINQKRIEHGN